MNLQELINYVSIPYNQQLLIFKIVLSHYFIISIHVSENHSNQEIITRMYPGGQCLRLRLEINPFVNVQRMRNH